MQKMPLHKLKIIIIYSYFIAVSPKAVLAILGSISTAQLCKQRKAKIEIMSIYNSSIHFILTVEHHIL